MLRLRSPGRNLSADQFAVGSPPAGSVCGSVCTWGRSGRSASAEERAGMAGGQHRQQQPVQRDLDADCAPAARPRRSMRRARRAGPPAGRAAATWSLPQAGGRRTPSCRRRRGREGDPVRPRHRLDLAHGVLEQCRGEMCSAARRRSRPGRRRARQVGRRRGTSTTTPTRCRPGQGWRSPQR